MPLDPFVLIVAAIRSVGDVEQSGLIDDAIEREQPLSLSAEQLRLSQPCRSSLV